MANAKYKFTASYDEIMGDIDLGSSNNLKELIATLTEKDVNDYHCQVTEWDNSELDAYGVGEIVRTVRLFELIEEQDSENAKLL